MWGPWSQGPTFQWWPHSRGPLYWGKTSAPSHQLDPVSYKSHSVPNSPIPQDIRETLKHRLQIHKDAQRLVPPMSPPPSITSNKLQDPLPLQRHQSTTTSGELSITDCDYTEKPREELWSTCCDYTELRKRANQGRRLREWTNVIHHINKLEEKTHDDLIRCWKSIWPNSTLIHDEDLGEIRYASNISKHNKSNIQLLTAKMKLN